jgi:hypothetical protein
MPFEHPDPAMAAVVTWLCQDGVLVLLMINGGAILR